MQNLKLQQLAKRWFSTDLETEPEEYILTPEEEKQALEHEISSAKKLFAWKQAGKGEQEEKILFKISQIDWEAAVDKEELFKRINSNKQHSLWHQKQRENEKKVELEKQKEIKQRCTAKYFYNLMAWTSENIFGKKLILHEDNKHFITALCFFLSGDERFETDLGYSFKKGLWIRGISGLGKTHLVRCIENNEISPIQILSMIEISEIVKQDGEFNIGLQRMIYLDDVGTEEHIVNHYGTKINWFKNFIETYYLKLNNYSKLLVSTNNNFDEIGDKYGFRVRSRVKDMFNVIDLSGNDMRG